MSVEEIKWWLTQLLDVHGWGSHCLRRTLGLSDKGSCNIVRHKADGRSWIYLTEQIRMSHQLRRIISGELVQQRLRRNGSGWIARAVIADHPQPLRAPLHWSFDFRRGTVAMKASEPPQPMLPNFRTMLADAKPWTNAWPGWDKPRRLKRLYYPVRKVP